MIKSQTLALTLLAIGMGSVESRPQSDENQPSASPSAKEQASELAKLREIFASVDKLPAKDARWVQIHVGSGEQEVSIRAWLVRESKAEIHLLTEHGLKAVIEKQKLATKVRGEDFAEFCRSFLAEKKKPVEANPDEIELRFQRERAEAAAAVVDAARLAAWASATGNDDLARQLLHRALDKLQERWSYGRLPRKLHEFVAGETSPQMEVGGDPWSDQDPRDVRVQSLKRNQALAKIPYRPDHETILAKIRQLESLIAEDKAWKEPSKEELVKMNVKQKATYWLHHLRDLDVRQMTQPGMCGVLTGWTRKGTPNSAVELTKLGYEVLPQIIAHLDDDRPTRCVGYSRFYAPKGITRWPMVIAVSRSLKASPCTASMI